MPLEAESEISDNTCKKNPTFSMTKWTIKLNIGKIRYDNLNIKAFKKEVLFPMTLIGSYFGISDTVAKDFADRCRDSNINSKKFLIVLY